ncbi:MAG: PIG-L deacetylase family protein [Candidatus Kariarchaeaceae archaeon]|jgi:LmbE family N-acetylglucosaminyl deacetylase
MNEILMTIFAHQDDETFSAGGVLAKYEQSYAVSVTKDINRVSEFQNACSILKTEGIQLDFESITETNFISVKNKLIDIIQHYKPDIVVTHVDFDYHREHKLTNEIVKEAIEWASHTTDVNKEAHQVKSLWGAETTVLIPFPHIYIDISETNQARMQAIKIYETQSHKGGSGFYSDFHGTRTKLRGIQANTDHAEVFINIPISLSGSFKPVKYHNSFP